MEEKFYPLYDILLSQVKAKPNWDEQLSDEEIRTLIININSMEEIGKNMIYLWIRIHSLKNTDEKIMNIPYGGEKIDFKKIENGGMLYDIKFDLRNFPPILNRMLLTFTELHMRKMEENNTKNALENSIKNTMAK